MVLTCINKSPREKNLQWISILNVQTYVEVLFFFKLHREYVNLYYFSCPIKMCLYHYIARVPRFNNFNLKMSVFPHPIIIAR